MPPAFAFAEALLVAVGLVVLVPAAVLFAEVLLAVTSGRDEVADAGERPTLAVLVPAHDEATVISATLRSITAQLVPADRLIVVADNCADDTAAVAAAAGAEVIERHDSTRKGKGYALDRGVHHLQSSPPDVVIIVDADCNVSAGSIDRLARECARTGRPIQALYLMYAPKDAGTKTRIAQFAFAVKNEVRPAGLHRLGLPCPLTGSGMAFPWPVLSRSHLATGHIVEDLKLGIELARAGIPPRFCPSALVTSAFPTSAEGIHSQRTRWEHGYLSVILTDAPGLFRRALVGRDARLLALACDLIVPPLALLALTTAALWLASAVLYALQHARYPLALATTALALLVLSVLLAWARYGRRILPLRELLFAPAYALWKVPLYVRFLLGRQLEWVRSKRDTHTP